MDSSLQRPTAARQLRLIRIKRKRGEAALETLVVEQEEGGGARASAAAAAASAASAGRGRALTPP
eukprot:COSAG01_NODE_9093_length_2559_cov_2.381707_1_plen_65_part_00